MTLRIALAALLVISAPQALARGNVEAGQQKSQVCQACHGPDGNGVGDGQYPLLAGQYADYLAKTLRQYRDGTRQNPIMNGFAATLSDQDIADLSAFYAAQSGPLRDMREVR